MPHVVVETDYDPAKPGYLLFTMPVVAQAELLCVIDNWAECMVAESRSAETKRVASRAEIRTDIVAREIDPTVIAIRQKIAQRRVAMQQNARSGSSNTAHAASCASEPVLFMTSRQSNQSPRQAVAIDLQGSKKLSAHTPRIKR